MAQKNAGRAGRLLLALLGSWGIINSTTPSPHKIAPEQSSDDGTAVDLRVENAREKLMLDLELEPSDPDYPKLIAQWYNWPNWNNWGNGWRNW